MWVFGGPYENVRRQMSVVRGDGIDMLISYNNFFPVFLYFMKYLITVAG